MKKKAPPGAKQMKYEPITDIRTELLDFVRFLHETGNYSIGAGINLPERDVLQRAVAKLSPAVDSVIAATDRDGDAALALWNALASAFIIGSRGTISDNTKTALAYDNTAKMRKGKAAKKNPKDMIMRQVVDQKLQPGDRDQPWKAAAAMLDSVNQALEEAGQKQLKSPTSIVTYLNKTQS